MHGDDVFFGRILCQWYMVNKLFSSFCIFVISHYLCCVTWFQLFSSSERDMGYTFISRLYGSMIFVSVQIQTMMSAIENVLTKRTFEGQGLILSRELLTIFFYRTDWFYYYDDYCQLKFSFR